MNYNKNIILVLILLLASAISGLSQEIHDAAREGDLTKMKMLLEKDPKLVNAKDETGRTPLHWACRGVHPDVVKFLVEKGADINALDNNQIAPLHSIAARGHTEAAELLIKKGAQINIKDYNSHTPLHFTAIYGKKDITTLLIANGAELEVRDDYGRTPLLLVARESGNVDVARILIEHGANVNAADNHGDTPLSLSAWRGYKDVVNLLIEKGADVPAKGPQSKELMQFATSKGLIKLFNILMNKGVEFNFRNDNDGTLLHSAAAGGSPEIVEILIKKGMNVNEKDRYERTPLHYACEKGHKAVVELLLKKGADINMKIIAGKTPLHLSLDGGYKEIATLLMAKEADQKPPVFPVLKGEYLGQKKPGSEPELFAKGIISSVRSEHCCCVFSPDGKEVYWGSSFPIPGSGYTMGKIFFMKRENNKWAIPQPAPFSSEFGEDVPFFSPDGKKLFFISRRPIEKGGKAGKENIWFVERIEDDWSEPKPVGPAVNSMDIHWEISVDKDYNLYFASRSGGGKGMNDIYCSKYENGRYQKPENLGELINTELVDDTPFIAPDKSYLIFARLGESNSFGGGDLYISFRKKDGSWTIPKNMGNRVNSKSHELCPIVSSDGKYLFFLSVINGNSDIYWMDAKIINELREEK